GLNNLSNPGHESLMIGVPHAAASNSRRFGVYPVDIMRGHVTFNVNRCALKNFRCSFAGRYARRCTFFGHTIESGYLGPATTNLPRGIWRAGSSSSFSSDGWHSAPYAPA